MTEERRKELQTEIAKLKEIDNRTTDRVRATYKLSDWADDKKSLDEIEVPCSKEQDEEWARESI